VCGPPRRGLNPRTSCASSNHIRKMSYPFHYTRYADRQGRHAERGDDMLVSWKRHIADRVGISNTGVWTAKDVIQSAGYPMEPHIVTTSDGYIMQMERIPRRGALYPDNSDSRVTHWV